MSKGSRNRRIRELDPDLPFEEYPPWLQKRVREAAKDLASQAIDRHLNDCDAIILWVLHSEFGFGKDRLRRYYDRFLALYNEFMGQYESFLDTQFRCQEELKRIGVNIEEWNRESA